MSSRRNQTLVGVIVVLLSSGARAMAQPLNVILIMSDDVGVEAFSCYGGESYETPRIDQLAREGVRFAHCHSQPLCTPSRVKLMTGLSNLRNYERFSVLPSDQLTFGHLLQRAGYRTAVVGKWQLLGAEHYGEWAGRGTLPEHAGFDEHCLWQVDRLGSRYGGPLVRENGATSSREGGYGPDVYTEYGCRFIRRHRARPFLLYFPMALVHSPYPKTPDGPRRKTRQGRFAAMMTYMDRCVGRLMDTVVDAGIADRTLILFTSDNGTGRNIVSRYKGRMVKGGKGVSTDRGTHVPLLGWGAGVGDPGRVTDDLVDFSDFLPTLLDAAGRGAPAGLSFDGVSFLPTLRGEQGGRRKAIVIWSDPRPGRTSPVGFARDERWKLYDDGRLFDLSTDPDEGRPLDQSSATSLVRARLQRALDRMPPDPERAGRGG